ncbi:MULTISPECIES: sodium:solute symporter family protein [Parachlamydia]|jgi:SSS family solute:Na+ symporter|uniref:Sodium/pantothenate symporter n=2 Tax=Parachlamydia acanthamoebae TaxID=83552 RepID=F8L1A3_PARAV|nr:sodium:solute symporter family protein [Parachlamydia acanthamoebae]CCB87031.1 putative uncharacterized protein [Parachlamydia acanthamoebae UV-7]
MDLTTFIMTLLGLQLICLFVGSKSAKETKTQEDYFLAGKQIRFFPLMMTFLATQVGGGLILGAAEEAYKFGWSVFLYPLGACLGLVLLGVGVGRKLSQFKVSTVAQIFEVVYKSSTLKKIASILSILSLFAIFIAQIIASKKFMLSVGVDNPIWFFIFWGIVIIYTCVGGLKAVISTDAVQAGFFVIVFFLCFGYAVFNLEYPLSVALSEGFVGENFTFDMSKFSGWLLMPLLFMVIEQDMGQRCFAAESPRIVSLATLCAAACTFFVSMIPIFFGIMARNSEIQIPVGSSVLMGVIQQMTNPFVTSLVCCAILVAIISTADSLINAVSSNLSQDFRFTGFSMNSVRFSQIISALIAISGIFFSFYFNNIVDLLILSYELSVSCLFIPLCFALYKKQGNKYAAGSAMLCGALGFILFRWTSLEIGREVCSLAFSLSGYFFGAWLFRTNSQEYAQS